MYMAQDIKSEGKPKSQPEGIINSAEVLSPEVPRGMETLAETKAEKEYTPDAPPEIIPNIPPEKIGEVYVSPPPPAGGAPQKDFVTKEVEAVMSKGMDKTFAELPPDLQLKFKSAGEEAAQKIRGFLSQAKQKAREILELIKSWLRLIPGVSRYFLEQEAKIKTDEILKIAEEENKKQ